MQVSCRAASTIALDPGSTSRATQAGGDGGAAGCHAPLAERVAIIRAGDATRDAHDRGKGHAVEYDAERLVIGLTSAGHSNASRR